MTGADTEVDHDDTSDWYHPSASAVLEQVGSSAAGLSEQEAAARLPADGSATLAESGVVHPLTIFLAQFKNIILWILIVAGVVSAGLHEVVDAATIFTIVVLNVAIGFLQEFRAERSIAALKALTAPLAHVRRAGGVSEVPATEVVIGDVLVLEAGDIVAADARLLKTAALSVMESALTGESEAVVKQSEALESGERALADRENLVFQGTSVAAGRGQAVVFATEGQTELGQIAGLLNLTETNVATPLQQKLDSFGKLLIGAALGVVVLLFGLGLLRHVPLFELTMTSVSLAVAAVPEGLPTVVTVALSLGVLRMSRRNALVRKLAAVETLGAVSVICTDKTGTLTRSEMTVQEYAVAPNYKQELLTILVGCNNAHRTLKDGQWVTLGDPMEVALLVAGASAGIEREQIERGQPRLRELPFDSERKRNTVVRTLGQGTARAFVNGAPGLLLERCTQLASESGVRPLTADDRVRILTETSRMAHQALRVLGSAYRDLPTPLPEGSAAEAIESELVFVGLTGLHDPPRPEAREAITRCHGAGVRVVMITGDNAHTASAIARELGIATDSSRILSGIELDALTDQALAEQAPLVAVYARVTAAHKLRIIRALKAEGAIVAMTGDGVNDAPAIKHADIGIAMGKTGTEVTKQAADMIITDDNFATIVAAIEEGRGIYENISKTLEYLLAGNTGELLLMTACVVVGLPAPLLPIHLLWINLVTDGLPALCLATDPIDPAVMTRPPRPAGARLIDRHFLRTMVLNGVLTAGVTFAEYAFVLGREGPEIARTHAFTILVFAELLRSFGARSEKKPLWTIPFFTNRSLVIVVLGSLLLQVISQHSAPLSRFLKTEPVAFLDCLFLLLLGALPMVILELLKVVRLHRVFSSLQKTR